MPGGVDPLSRGDGVILMNKVGSGINVDRIWSAMGMCVDGVGSGSRIVCPAFPTPQAMQGHAGCVAIKVIGPACCKDIAQRGSGGWRGGKGLCVFDGEWK